jgi:hypothetical protein
MVRLACKKGAELDWAVAHLNGIRTQKRNRVSYSEMDYSYLRSVLHSFVDAPYPIDHDLLHSWVGEALFSPTKTGSITSAGLLRDMNMGANAYLRRPEKSYYLLTSLSYGGDPPVTWTIVGGARVTLRFHKSKFPRRDPKLAAIHQDFPN